MDIVSIVNEYHVEVKGILSAALSMIIIEAEIAGVCEFRYSYERHEFHAIFSADWSASRFRNEVERSWPNVGIGEYVSTVTRGRV